MSCGQGAAASAGV